MGRAKNNGTKKSLVRVEGSAGAPLSRGEAGMVKRFVESVLSNPRCDVLPTEIPVEELIRKDPALAGEAVELLAQGKS
jgi:hypothetical protein